MKKEKTANLAAIVIGFIGMVAALIPAFNSEPFEDYAFLLMISFTLLGVGLINLKNLKNGNR